MRFEVEGRRDLQYEVCVRVAERLAHRRNTGSFGPGTRVNVLAVERSRRAAVAAKRKARIINQVDGSVGSHNKRGDIFGFAAVEGKAKLPQPQAPSLTVADRRGGFAGLCSPAREGCAVRDREAEQQHAEQRNDPNARGRVLA